MRRPMFPLSSVAVFAACLLALGRAPAARAEVATGPFDRFVAAWMGVVGVIGADAEMEDEPAAAESFAAETDANTFTIDEENADREAGEEKAQRRRERRERDHGEGGRRHHRGGHGHGGHAHDAPPMRGPRHPGMGAGHMGHHPGGPAMHHHALRAFHEIIRRLGRIEEKLGIEAAPPSGPHGEQRWQRPEMRRPRGPAAERPLPRLDIPEDMRRQMEERMREGRRRMEEAKGRMEEARKRFQAMEERIKQLEAEIERLKGAK
jgi:hypothetical protein